MYATVADMLLRYEELDLIQLTNGNGSVDADRVQGAIARAGVEINAFVAAKYRTGTDPVPELLTELACRIAYYHLHRDTPPEKVKTDHDSAIARLKEIAKGVIKLDAGEETVPARDGAILVDRPERIFGRDSMGGY